MKLYRSEPLRLVAWGDFGLFTRPAFRADRVTQPLIPPTAAKGLVKAIAWHPEAKLDKGEHTRLEVETTAIHVLNPIRTMRMRMNEVERLPVKDRPYEVTPKQTSLVVLKEPKYLIEFNYIATSPDIAKKFAEMFKRRLSKGQTFRQPCFGRRRYVAFVREATDADRALPVNRDLGDFPWHIEYKPGKRGLQMVLHTFKAHLTEGVLRVPSYYDACLERSEEVRL